MIPDMSERIGDESVVQLLSTHNIALFEEHSLFMHLYRALGTVLAIREAMWDELQDIIKRKPEALTIHGWEPTDFQNGMPRRKFDAMVEQYKG